MTISDVSMSELWVTGFAFVVPAIVALFEGVVLLDICTLGVDESLPAAVVAVGTMLALWWPDDG